MFACLECGRKFKGTRAAERAAMHGCPKCGGVDIDLDVEAPSVPYLGDDEENYGGAFDGFNVTSDADPGL